MFPSDVEEALKQLQEAKKVKCYIYKGTVYTEFLEDGDIDEIFGDCNPPTKPEKKSDPMFA